MKALLLAAAVAAGLSPAMAETASLVISVERVSPKGGNIILDLFTAANYHDNDHPTRNAIVPANPAGTIIQIDGIEPGVYAIKAMQDIDRDGLFDMSWAGMPLEPYGFSNHPRIWFSEPSFERTKFTIGPGVNVITIRLSETDGLSVER